MARPPSARPACSRPGRYSTITIAPGGTARLDLAPTASQPSSDFAAPCSSSGSPFVPGAPSAACVALPLGRCARAQHGPKAVRAHEQPLSAAARAESPAASRSSPACAMPGIVGCGQTLWRQGYRARVGCSSHARVVRSTARCLIIKRLAYRHRQASASYRLAALATHAEVERSAWRSARLAQLERHCEPPAEAKRVGEDVAARAQRQPEGPRRVVVAGGSERQLTSRSGIANLSAMPTRGG